jgi:L-threonylcarbamoyladenylate synthase
VLQSSANASGGPDARRAQDVPDALRAGADLVLDAGELAGTPSTVVDLRGFEAGDAWSIRREGAVAAERIAAAAARILPPED